MKSDMGITPDVPGTGSVTDVPQPNTDPYHNEPGAPDIEPGGKVSGEERSENARGAFSGIREQAEHAAVNPFSGSPTGGTGNVNPSAPTRGTEDWGGHAEQRSAPAEQPQERSIAMSDTEHVSQQGERKVNFRCSDIHPECKWEASGSSFDDLMPQIEQHGREKHRLQEFGQEMKEKIRNMMQKRVA